MYIDFNYADQIMRAKGFSGLAIVNLNDHKEWAYTKSEVLVFSRPKNKSTSSGNFQFELQKALMLSVPQGEYDNYFFSKNLNDVANSTCCFFKNSNSFPLKEDPKLLKVCSQKLDDELFISAATLRKTASDRYYLSQFKKLEKNLFINFITKFKIKLYKHNDTDEYAFFWLLNNNINIKSAKVDLLAKFREFSDSEETIDKTKGIYESLIEIQNKIDLEGVEKNQIIYGSPGTGKSYYLDNLSKCLNNVFTVTFHPDYDYTDFVGLYKPKTIRCKDNTQDNNDCKSKTIYKFIPGIFLKALKKALANPDENVILKIEEINRGNTAAIFGDIFQLLDRNENGFSKYTINASDEIIDFLGQDTINIPSNLFIWATMNTSDQSLYPIDSAFKRRWTWKHIPIDMDDAKKLIIKIDGLQDVNWSDFITIVNSKILTLTDSEDKQLGNRFVNPKDAKITVETFVGKVLFYLWTDIFKHEDHFDENNIFKSLKLDSSSENEKISFSLLHNSDGSFNHDYIKKILSDLDLI